MTINSEEAGAAEVNNAPDRIHRRMSGDEVISAVERADYVRADIADLNQQAADALVEWRAGQETSANDARIPVQHLVDYALSENERRLWTIAGQLMQQRGIKSRFE